MKLKLTPNLFLGLQEQKHWNQSVKEKGYERFLKQVISSYGIIQSFDDSSFESLKVVKSGPDEITIKAGLAVDINQDMIDVTADLVDEFQIPSDNVIRYVVIKYAETALETGTVDIQANGTIVGTDTQFTERMRGLPNIPSKITFPQSSNNTQEYTIQAIQNDTLGSLNVVGGTLVAETNQSYAVVGTFTPGVAINSADKYPFQNDGYVVELRTSNTVIDGVEFLLASTQYDGTDLTIIDLRNENKFTFNKNKEEIISPLNPLIGIEEIRYDNLRNAKDKNLVKVGWGLTALNGQWTVNPQTQEVTITTVYGGAWRDNTNFNVGDLNNWRVVFHETGEVVNVLGSQGPSTQILLSVEFLATYPTSGEISVIPNADFVEIIMTSATDPVANTKVSFAAKSRWGYIPLMANTTATVQWRHILEDQTTSEANIVDGDYLNEDSFEENGATKIITSSTTITSATITTLLSPDNFKDVLIPQNLITMYSGSIGSIPSGWALCDGTNGTPDLKGKFIVGYDPTDTDYDTLGNNGGAKTKTLTESNLPPHHHEAVGDNATIAINNSGSHSHSIQSSSSSTGSGQLGRLRDPNDGQTNTDTATHSHSNSDFTGKVGDGSTDGLASTPLDIRAPYYTLAYIIKL